LLIAGAGVFFSGTFFHTTLLTLSKILKEKNMGNLLYIIALVLVIAWAIGFLGYQAGGLIHLLLVIAVIAIILKVIRRAAD
jgi:Family of unknown function (DUF5670)